MNVYYKTFYNENKTYTDEQPRRKRRYIDSNYIKIYNDLVNSYYENKSIFKSIMICDVSMNLNNIERIENEINTMKTSPFIDLCNKKLICLL